MDLIRRIWRKCRSLTWQLASRVYIAALRLLRQLPDPQPEEAKADGKVIYLTFDDGPSRYTEQLLEILDRYRVKATFFVTDGPNRLDVLPKISAAGHSVGNHTANHNYKTLYASETAFLDALIQMETIILDKTGTRPTLFRFPGGSESIDYHSPHGGMSSRLIALVQSRGYRYFDWDLDSKDSAEARTPGAIYANVISGVRNREKTVVLLHDIHKRSVDAVERILIWGIKNGYTFLPLGTDSR